MDLIPALMELTSESEIQPVKQRFTSVKQLLGKTGDQDGLGAQGVCLGAWDDKDGREGLQTRQQYCWDHKRISYSVSRKNSVLGRAKALRQESICSRQSETGNKAVGVCDILDELDEAQEARAPGSCNSFTIIFLPFLIPLVSFHNASGASLVAQW